MSTHGSSSAKPCSQHPYCVAHNRLELQLQGITCPLLASPGIHTHVHRHTNNISKKVILCTDRLEVVTETRVKGTPRLYKGSQMHHGRQVSGSLPRRRMGRVKYNREAQSDESQMVSAEATKGVCGQPELPCLKKTKEIAFSCYYLLTFLLRIFMY